MNHWNKILDTLLIALTLAGSIIPADMMPLHLIVGDLFLLIVFIHAAAHLKKAALYIAFSITIGLAMEVLGVHTGFPFGRYEYVEGALGYAMIGGVPIAIPLLWSSLAYLAMQVGYAVAGPRLWIPASAATLTLLDVILDPILSGRLWIWLTPGEFYGVPVTNFLGWLLVATMIYAAYRAVGGGVKRVSTPAVVAFLILASVRAAEAAASGMWLAALLGYAPIAALSLYGAARYARRAVV